MPIFHNLTGGVRLAIGMNREEGGGGEATFVSIGLELDFGEHWRRSRVARPGGGEHL